ncbi:MAG: hypothetical protein FWH26_00170 [Oscillospiraceae bacterium]|nr:hypothetical protein [Oscillospiraceae bacterium]
MKLQKRTGKILLSGLILSCLLCLLMPMASAAPAAVTLTVNQVFAKPAAAGPLAETFQYRLEPIQATNPMVMGTVAGVYAFSITGNSEFDIGPIAFPSPGKYSYRLLHATEPAAGYVYDETVYTLEVLVKADGTYSVVASKEGGDKQEALEYRHSYQTNASDPLVMVDPPVVKTVIGIPRSPALFSFELVAGSPGNPMPAGSVDGVKTVWITGSGSAEFGVWAYTQPGVYYYTVSEVNTGARDYNYDTTVYTITDTVSAVDGELEVSRVVTNGANRQVTSLSFINIYKGSAQIPAIPIPVPVPLPLPVPVPLPVPGATGPGDPGDPGAPGVPGVPGAAGPNDPVPAGTGGTGSNNAKLPGKGPKTGDESQTLLFTFLFCAGTAAALFSAGYLVIPGRRRANKRG